MNTNEANEDQRVPARPAADQQNPKGNSCHTPRTKAAGAGSTPSEITAANANVGSVDNAGHAGAVAVKAAPSARRFAVDEP